MFDGTIKKDLKVEDSINCKGIIIEEVVTPLEFEEMLKRKLTITDKVIFEMTQKLTTNEITKESNR